MFKLGAPLQCGPATLSVQLSGLRCVGSSRRGVPNQFLREEKYLDEAFYAMDQHCAVSTVLGSAALLEATVERPPVGQKNLDLAHLAEHHSDSFKTLRKPVASTSVNFSGSEQAQILFHGLPQRAVISWTAMIFGCTRAGEYRKALSMYHKMQEEGVVPQKRTFICAVQACGRITDLQAGRGVHADIVKHRFDSDIFVSTCLVSMYAECGSLVDAQLVFDNLSHRDVVSWNAMLAAYAHQGQGMATLQLFQQMHEEGVPANDRTFVSVLQACGKIAEKEDINIVDGKALKLRALWVGQVLHARIQTLGYETDMFVASALVSMYAKCGSVMDARRVFDGLSQRDVVSWTAMLSALAQQGQAEEALQLYERMKEQKLRFDARSLVSVIQACSILAEKEEDAVVDGRPLKRKSMELGRAIHEEAVRRGHGFYLFLCNALISMYGKCGGIVEARHVFDNLLQRDVVSWNAILTTCAQQALAEECLQLYSRMSEENISPNVTTFVCVLQAYSCLAEKEASVLTGDGSPTTLESLRKGKTIHAEARSRGYESDVFVGSALISLYGKCGSIADAQDVFDRLPKRDVVVWNAILAAHVQLGLANKALELFEKMELERILPNETTYMHILQACSHVGVQDICAHIHKKLVLSATNLNLSLGNTLIDTYSKCASMKDAQAVFDALSQPDVVSWNVLIAGYAREGNLDESLRKFDEMQGADVKPDKVTFLSLLAACSHAGMVDEGVAYFQSMSRDYDISPGLDHYVCMVDLFGRAGYFNMVEQLISGMPMRPNLALWLCLLACCRKHGNVVLAERAFDCALRLQRNQAAAYVLMTNIYADAGMWESASKVGKLRDEGGAWDKFEPGQTWIEHGQEVRTFTVGNNSRQWQQDAAYDLLNDLSSELK